MSAKQKKLSELKPGDIFLFAGFRWVKLEDTAEGTKVIAADTVEERAFDNANRNNWKNSTLREYLNGDFLKYLCGTDAKPGDFLTVVSDLTADDGLKDCGISEDKIALITCDDYRKYRNIIPPIVGWWWTLTPHSCKPQYSSVACYVSTSGALYSYDADTDDFGVRPFLNLKSDITVSLEETGEEEEKESAEDAKEKVLRLLRLLSEAIEIMRTL